MCVITGDQTRLFTHKAACSEGFRDSGGRNRGHDPIAQAGGGVVESYPQDTEGKKTSASFLYNATRSLFEQAGFTTSGARAYTIP